MGRAATRHQAQAERLLTRSHGGNSTVASMRVATLETGLTNIEHRVIDESDIELVGYIGRARYARIKRTGEEIILTGNAGHNALESDKVNPSIVYVSAYSTHRGDNGRPVRSAVLVHGRIVPEGTIERAQRVAAAKKKPTTPRPVDGLHQFRQAIPSRPVEFRPSAEHPATTILSKTPVAIMTDGRAELDGPAAIVRLLREQGTSLVVSDDGYLVVEAVALRITHQGCSPAATCAA